MYPGAPMGYPAPVGRPITAAPYTYSAPPVAYAPVPYPMVPMPGMPMPMPGMPYPMPPMPGLLPTPMMSRPTAQVTGTIVKAPAATTSGGQKHTTVYVGRIAPSVEDEFLRLVLQQCGPVASWKRVTDPINNQARAFGFCTYENAEGVLRALRVLNDYDLDGRPLLVKVDDNTQQYLQGYEREKKALEERRKAHLAEAIANGEEVKKELTPEELDAQVKGKINTLVAERKTGVFFEKYFLKDGDDNVVIPVAEGEVVAGHEIDKQKAVVVAQEIKNFRVRQAIRDKEKTVERDDDDKTDKDRQVDREYEREQREKERERARVREQRSRDRERESRKREREKREFREREREWVIREKEKERERERREREDERERERQMERELDYDEEEDKQMRKAGRRKRIREREEIDDEEDRKAEREEERLQQEKEMELLRKQQEEEERKRREEEERREAEELRRRPLQKIDLFSDYNDSPSRQDGVITFSPSSSIDQRINQAKKLGFGFAAEPKKLSLVTPGFVPDEEPHPMLAPRKKKLVPLDPMKSEEQIKKEREEEAKSIVKLIPTGKDELFVYPMDWDTIDAAGIVPKRMKPWVTKKIVEYLGEEEPTLIDFVVSKMASHMTPQDILGQLAFVLEDEAEVFVIKLWRMLIFEMIRAQRDKEREVAAVGQKPS